MVHSGLLVWDVLMKKGFLTETATPVSKSKQCPLAAPGDV